MEVLIDDTLITLDIDSFDEHIHGQYCSKSAITGDINKPFRVGYVTLTSNERFEPVRDVLTVFIDIYLAGGLYPKMKIWAVNVEELSEQAQPCGGFGEQAIDSLLSDLADAIHYHEI